jgi:hypothetical protein
MVNGVMVVSLLDVLYRAGRGCSNIGHGENVPLYT